MRLAESKTLRILSLLAFSWLALYQVYDRFEDMAEDLGISAQLASSQQRQLLPLPAPENEPDASIPPIVDRTLVSGQSDGKIVSGPSIRLQIQDQLPARVIVPLTFKGNQLVLTSSPVSCLTLDRSPAHSLAPPLA